MDVKKAVREISFVLKYELKNSLSIAKENIDFHQDFITGEQLIRELMDSNYGEKFRQILGTIQERKLYKGSIMHGIDHVLRTSLIAGYIALKEGIDPNDFKMIIQAAMYHDIGRINDQEDSTHGRRASDKLDSIVLEQIEPEEKNILKAMISAHSVDDRYMSKVFESYGITDMERARILTCILKDADALDRVRLGGSVDPAYLRTETSKKLIPAAYDIYININSIGAMPEQWMGIEEYIKTYIDEKLITQKFEDFRKMSEAQKEQYVMENRKTGREKFKEIISLNFKKAEKLDKNNKHENEEMVKNISIIKAKQPFLTKLINKIKKFFKK